MTICYADERLIDLLAIQIELIIKMAIPDIGFSPKHKNKDRFEDKVSTFGSNFISMTLSCLTTVIEKYKII